MKTCVITGSRAEYGLLKPLIYELQKDENFQLQLLVTGMHLSPEFGMTCNEIVKDEIPIDDSIEILLSSDQPVGISKSMGLGMISFAESYNRLKPDLIIVLGDRFEIFSAVSSAMVMNIPCAHIHGGESTTGVYDEGFRHSISKMSHLHFTSTEVYRKRVIQLGEHPDSVYNVGALAVDNVSNIDYLSLKELEEALELNLECPFFMVSFHPVTLGDNTAESQFTELLDALDHFQDFQLIFTKPNADHGGRLIGRKIDSYVKKQSHRACSFDSLGQLKYLSALKHAEMLIGNSSSGIIEMPLFFKPTVDIGDRQEGRIKADSIISCLPEKNKIIAAIEQGTDPQFLNRINNQTIPYGSGKTASSIRDILDKTDLSKILKKAFFDINYKLDNDD